MTRSEWITSEAELDRLLMTTVMWSRDSRRIVPISLSTSERVTQGAFVAAIPPFLVKESNNPSGMDGSIFEVLSTTWRRRPSWE